MNRKQDFLPAAPLHDLIRRRIADTASVEDWRYGGSLKSVGRRIALRLDTREDTVGRLIQRVLHSDTVTVAVADTICTGLRTHVGEVWGWDVYESARAGAPVPRALPGVHGGQRVS